MDDIRYVSIRIYVFKTEGKEMEDMRRWDSRESRFASIDSGKARCLISFTPWPREHRQERKRGRERERDEKTLHTVTTHRCMNRPYSQASRHDADICLFSVYQRSFCRSQRNAGDAEISSPIPRQRRRKIEPQGT